MKPSPMPPRTVPLRSTATLSRTKRLAPVGARKRRTLAAEAAFREALRERSGGMCEVSTPACPPGPHPGCDPHHRCHADRDRGVHDPERGLWACRLGHDWIETHPAESYAVGWLLRDGAA